MPTVLPTAVRRMWLRRFGAVTRLRDWPSSVPSVRAVRNTLDAVEQDVFGMESTQNGSVLVCEAGALGADAGPGAVVTHDGVTVELEAGPYPLTSDRAWEYWTLVV